MLSSRNAVCILAFLVAGILTATYSLLFVVKRPNLDLNVSIDSKCFSRKQNVSPDNGILFETFHITPRRHICLTEAVILSSTSNFFTTIATLCNKHATSRLVKNMTNNYFFHLSQHSNGSLRKRMVSSAGSTEVMSVGCTCLISIHVDFGLW